MKTKTLMLYKLTSIKSNRLNPQGNKMDSRSTVVKIVTWCPTVPHPRYYSKSNWEGASTMMQWWPIKRVFLHKFTLPQHSWHPEHNSVSTIWIACSSSNKNSFFPRMNSVFFMWQLWQQGFKQNSPALLKIDGYFDTITPSPLLPNPH